MKAFFLVLLLPLMGWAKCLDFSGEYKWISDDGENFIRLSIKQIKCEQSEMEYDAGWGFTVRHKHYFDGKRRLVEDNGDFQAYEKALIDSKAMLIQEDRHNFTEEGQPHTYFVDYRISLSLGGDLLMHKETLNEQQQIIDSEDLLYKKNQ
jgi:hypothetical protein